MTAFLDHINNCIALVIEHRQEWLGEITAFQESVDSKVQALIDEATALRRRRGDFSRLQHWIHRTAIDGAEMPAAHFPYSEIAPPPSGDPAEEEARDLAMRLRSYAGSPAPQQPISEEQMRDVRQANVASQRQTPTDEVGVELSHLDEDDLVDWLMGTGMFDSEARPPAAVVVDAAGDDPDLAARLLRAELRANPEATRPEVIDALTEISNRKDGA